MVHSAVVMPEEVSPVPLQPREENPKKPTRQDSHSLPSTPARHTHWPVIG